MDLKKLSNEEMRSVIIDIMSGLRAGNIDGIPAGTSADEVLAEYDRRLTHEPTGNVAELLDDMYDQISDLRKGLPDDEAESAHFLIYENILALRTAIADLQDDNTDLRELLHKIDAGIQGIVGTAINSPNSPDDITNDVVKSLESLVKQIRGDVPWEEDCDKCKKVADWERLEWQEKHTNYRFGHNYSGMWGYIRWHSDTAQWEDWLTGSFKFPTLREAIDDAMEAINETN